MTPHLLLVISWALACSGDPSPPSDVKLFFSEYAEGSSNNKYLEIYNGGSATADLDDFAFPNTNNAVDVAGQHEYWNTFAAGAKLPPDGVYVIAHPQADPAILILADETHSYLSNGDDGYALAYGVESNYTIIDTIGDFQADPGTGWDVCGVSIATKDHTLVRKPAITQGNPDWDLSRGTDAQDCEWQVYPIDTWDYLGTHNETQKADEEDPSDPDSKNYYENCSSIPTTPIGTVQGSGSSSSMVNSPVVIRGVVTAVFQSTLRGYFLQESGPGDKDAATSDGIFVYDTSVTVVSGDLVVVSGTVKEQYGMTQLDSVSEVTLCGKHPLPLPILLSHLPTRKEQDATFESFEGMLIMLMEPVVVTDFYNLGRYGEMTLSDKRNIYPSQLVDPSSSAHQDMYDALRDTLTMDDGNSAQNPDPVPFPGDGLTADNILRTGDTLANVMGPLHYSYSKWRVHLTPGFPRPAVFHTHPRPTSLPDVGGAIRVASLNALNYFNGPNPGPDFSDGENRGADDLEEFHRQRNKTIAALLAMDAAVVSLQEVENDGFGPNSAVQDIVNSLNAATSPGQYAVVDFGVSKIGTDAIACPIIYQPSLVRLIGTPSILDSSVDAEFNQNKNRPALAASFEELKAERRFTVVNNHLKSKGSSCESCCSDPEIDGVGNCNGVRTNATGALGRWLQSHPTGINTDDILIIGDLNSYHFETPIQRLINDFNYTDMIDHFRTKEASWSYVYQGLSGYLDHALASQSMKAKITGVQEWHINGDENRMLDYNKEYKSPSQVESLYHEGMFRSSDHDPIIIGLFAPRDPSSSTVGCDDVRTFYRENNCCGNPAKELQKPSWCM